MLFRCRSSRPGFAAFRLRTIVLWLALVYAHGCKDSRQATASNDELVIAAPADGYNTEVGSDLGIYPVNANIYETLVRLTADYRVEPMLAASWEFRPPNTWRFHLRRGVMMHDGSVFGAEAVMWTMQRIARQGGGTMGIGLESAQVLDDSTVDITPVRTNIRLVEQLAHPNWSVIGAGSEPMTRPIGTGPFRFAEYVKGEHLAVERFPEYWGDRAKLGRLRFNFTPDPNTRVRLLRSGSAHIAFDLPREITGQVDMAARVGIVTSAVGGYEALYVSINGRTPYELGRDSTIRAAVANAIDRQAIVSRVWSRSAEASPTVIPPALLGQHAKEIRGRSFDRALAARILDGSGWIPGPDGVRVKRGRRLTLTMVVGFPNPYIHKPMPELVQAQLKAVGIEMRIVQLPDNAAYQARVRSGEGDLWAEAGGQNDANPCFLPELLFYSGGVGGRPTSYNRLFAPGPELDRSIEGCRSATDSHTIRRHASDAMRLLVDEETVVIPLAGTYRVWGVSDQVRGFDPHPSNLSQRWNGVWLNGRGEVRRGDDKPYRLVPQ